MLFFSLFPNSVIRHSGFFVESDQKTTLLVNPTCKYGCLQSVILSAFHTVFAHQSKSTQPETPLTARGQLGYNWYVTKHCLHIKANPHDLKLLWLEEGNWGIIGTWPNTHSDSNTGQQGDCKKCDQDQMVFFVNSFEEEKSQMLTAWPNTSSVKSNETQLSHRTS